MFGLSQSNLGAVVVFNPPTSAWELCWRCWSQYPAPTQGPHHCRGEGTVASVKVRLSPLPVSQLSSSVPWRIPPLPSWWGPRGGSCPGRLVWWRRTFLPYRPSHWPYRSWGSCRTETLKDEKNIHMLKMLCGFFCNYDYELYLPVQGITILKLNYVYTISHIHTHTHKERENIFMENLANRSH